MNHNILKYEKVLFGFNPCCGLWGLIDDSFVYKYVDENLFKKLFRFYSMCLWNREVSQLSELNSMDILTFKDYYKIPYHAEINSKIEDYTDDRKCDLILAMTQCFNSQFEYQEVFWRKRNLYYLSLFLHHRIKDYDELADKDYELINKSKLIIYGCMDDAIHEKGVHLPFKDVIKKLSNKKDLYTKAVEYVKKNPISIPILQRVFTLNYHQAINLMEKLEENGVVCPIDKDGKRKL